MPKCTGDPYVPLGPGKNPNKIYKYLRDLNILGTPYVSVRPRKSPKNVYMRCLCAMWTPYVSVGLR